MAREDRLFLSYLETGDPEALGRAFDVLAPRLLGMALHLARDPAHAEDLLQATFLTAIEKADGFDRSKPVQPWLMGILTRHAAKAREANARRIDPERLARPAPADPATAAENGELVQRLRKQLDRLPEKYRQPLLLKLVHGMQPAEIAEVLGVAPGTLRMRLHRGLAKLRRLVPASLLGAGLVTGLRGMEAVRSAVLDRARITRPTPVSIGGASVGGVLALKKVLAPATALAGLVVLCLAWPVPPFAPNLADRATAGLEPLSAPIEPQPWDPFRPATAAEAARLQLAPEPDAAGTVSLSLRVLSTVDDRPLTHVGVAVTPQDGSDPLLTRRDARTSANGTARFEDLRAGPVKIELDREFSERTATIEGETEVVVRVPPGITVEGRVVGSGGEAVPFASLWVSSQRGRWSEFEVGRTDAHGRFRLEELVSRYNFVAATAPGHAPSYGYRVEGEPGDTVRLEIPLEGPGAALRGRVVDRGGEPVAGALVIVGGYGGRPKRTGPRKTLDGWSARRVFTDSEGRFLEEGLPPGWVHLIVRAEGHAPLSRHVDLEASRSDEVTLEPVPGVDLHGRIRGPDGGPIRGARIWVEAYGIHEAVSTVSGVDGGYSIAGLSAERIALRIRADGYGIHETELQASPGEEIAHDVVLERRPVLRGRVVDAEDRPLSGWRVVLTGNESGARVTDAEGCFEIPFESPGAREVLLLRRLDWGWARIPCDWLGPILPREEELRIRVPQQAMPSSWLRGRLLEADGSPVQEGNLSLQHGDLAAGNHEVDADGAFRIGPLSGGSYRITLGGPWTGTPPTRLGPYAVRDGEVLDLGEVRLPEPGTVELTLSRSDGVPIEDPFVFFFTPDRWEIVGAFVDETGRCSQPLRPGSYSVRCMVANGTWAARRFEIRAGEVTKLDIALQPAVRRYVSFPVPEPEGWSRTGRVRFTIRDPAGRLLDDRDYDPAREHPYRYMPAFAPGRYTLDMELDSGRRYRGTFEVPDLRPSDVPIRIAVSPIR